MERFTFGLGASVLGAQADTIVTAGKDRASTKTAEAHQHSAVLAQEQLPRIGLCPDHCPFLAEAGETAGVACVRHLVTSTSMIRLQLLSANPWQYNDQLFPTLYILLADYGGQLCRRYYSEQVCAQTNVHSLFPLRLIA